VKRPFWSFVYTIYGLGGRAVSSRRSRRPELLCFALAVFLLVMWSMAVPTVANYSKLPFDFGAFVALAVGGLFFRHVRIRSAENPRYLAEKRSAR
jgi:hypothetical protein